MPRDDEQVVEAVLSNCAHPSQAVNLVSRSRMRKCTRQLASSSSVQKLRAPWVTQEEVGSDAPLAWARRRQF